MEGTSTLKCFHLGGTDKQSLPFCRLGLHAYGGYLYYRPHTFLIQFSDIAPACSLYLLPWLNLSAS